MGVNYNKYAPPTGFNWDWLHEDTPIQDDHRLNDYNVPEILSNFTAQILQQAAGYRDNHVLVTMGRDFLYSNANEWFKNMDKLIYQLNSQQDKYGLNVFYSTPSIYLEAKNAANSTWSIVSSDNLPYADFPHAYWTGYFTSRPALKAYIRDMSSYLQLCKQVDVWNYFIGKNLIFGNASMLADAMGIAQHHDAVTGTERQHVAYDYAQRLNKGQVQCENNIKNFLSGLAVSRFPTLKPPTFGQCQLLNVSACILTDSWDGSSPFILSISNPLMTQRSGFVQFPVSVNSGFTIIDSNMNSVPFQINQLTEFDIKLQQQAQVGLKANYLVTFYATNLQPNSISTFFASPSNLSSGQNSQVIEIVDDFKMENDFISVSFSSTTGKITDFVNKMDGSSVSLDQNWYYYESSNGTIDDPQASGAYIFRPAQEYSHVVSESVQFSYSKGPLYDELIQYFGDYIMQRVKVYHVELFNSSSSYNLNNFFDIEYTVGPIPVQDMIGKEIMSTFKTSIESNNQFFTDSNGRSMRYRQLNYRPTWDLNVTEPISCNFYPINSAIYVNDVNSQFTVLVDRSQAGASINSGEIELMAHRRLVNDV